MDHQNENDASNSLKSISVIILSIILLLGVPRLAGLIVHQFNYQQIDPDDAFAWMSVRHVIQMLIFLLIIVVLIKTKGIDFQLGKGDPQEGLSHVKKFTFYFFLLNALSYLIMYLSGAFAPYPKPMTARNIVGYLGFSLFLSGPSEELIFRAFAMTIFAIYVPGKIGSSKISKANLLAAIVFAAAHIGIQYDPFLLTIDPMHLLFCAGLGLIYGISFEKSKSVYYPAIMHSISNFIVVGSLFVLTVLI